ncbi:MAG: lasso RiPP family leader peptide-containing protein [Pseudonocardiaceae bacterium]
MDEINKQQTEAYEPPALTEIGPFVPVTKGQYSRPNSDDSDAGGYWSK